MSAGTITLTNKSAVVSGNGTSFTTDLAAGDFIVATVGGIAYTLPVLSIASATSLTLVSNFTGPTQSGNAWNAVPRVALNMVTAALVTQSAEALRGLNYDKQNWQSVFTGTGTITVTLPDGSTFSGPSWKYLSDNMATKVSGAVPVVQGGTGSTTAAGARTNLGLGSAATLNYGANAGQVITNQQTYNFNNSDFVGKADGISPGVNIAGLLFDGFYRKVLGPDGPDTAIPTAAQNGTGYSYAMSVNLNASYRTQIFFPYASLNNSGSLCWRGIFSGNVTPMVYSRDSRNTTVDSNGFIKTASPIVKVFTDGSYETNEESDGVNVTRQGVGQYLIEGCCALNSDAAWGGIDGGFELPTDRNKQPLIWLDYEVNADGSVLVKTYHRTNPGAPEFARNEIEGLADGEPVDIPTDQFISVRVQMPACSIWNQKQEEAIDAMRKFESEELTDPKQG